ncbi:MAG TPA: choice-of-anchor D domain-containing protein, partial [Sporolactobacillaceae bacterium]|nr:choice-of-anchor D domain-containing protein [Sporolactobacillaceae bacterium]
VFTTSGCNLGSATISASTLCGPEGLATDPAGNLFVSDQTNNRALEFNLPLAPANIATGAGDAVADRVFGQAGNLTTGVCNGGTNTISANTLCSPGGLAIDGSGNLYVADVNNSRVLEFNQPITAPTGATGAGDTIADRVFGQGATGITFTTNACASSTAPPPPSATGACRPAGLSVDIAGDLFIADSFNNRVLEYNQPLAAVNAQTGAGDVTADRVFGQGIAGTDFVTSACADKGSGDPPPSASAMCRPGGVAIDSLGNLYVADESNNRVIRFDIPLGPFTGPTPTATPTGSAAPTPSATPTSTVATATATPTSSASATVSATQSPSPTPTPTASSTPTSAATPTPTSTPTSTASSTATSGSTPTPTATSTSASTSTATTTQTPTRTSTPTASATATATASATATATATSTPSASATPSPTPTNVRTPVQTPTATATPTRTPTATPTPVGSLAVSPHSLSLGNVVFGASKTSKPKRMVITNTSTAAVTFTNIVATGDFSRVSGCGPTIAPHKKCKVTIKFSPTALGTRNGALTVTSSATNSPLAVPLSGNGTTRKK